MRNAASGSSKTRLFLSITAALAGLGASLATAQQNQNSSAPLEEIQVTGSRIRLVDGMSAPTPVTAVTIEELNNFDPGTTMAAQLDDLPQFFDTPNAQRGGNAISTTGGGSYLNLRGMGLNRTLVVLDGTRVAPQDAQGSVNVDLFPSALIQRIDVVTGGASAAYGADAVAGVVNFVLDREFEGFKTRVSTGITERRDAGNYNISLVGGRSFLDDRLHLISSVEGRHIDEIPNQQKDRWDNNLDWGRVRNPEWVSATATPNVPQRITVPYVFTALSSPQGLIIETTPGFAYRNWTFTDNGADIRPYQFGDYLSISGAGAQNNQSGGPEYLYWDAATRRGPSGNKVDQRSGFLGLKFDLNERLTLTAQAAAGRSEASASGQHASMGNGTSQYAWKIFRNNAYLPQRLADEMDRLKLDVIRLSTANMIDGPGLINIYDDRVDRSIQQQQMYTVGFNFNIDDNWNLNGAYQRGEAKTSTGMLNIARIDKFFMATDAVRDPATGKIMCNITLRNPSAAELKQFMEGKRLPSPIDPLGVTADSPIGPLNPLDCVPINPFGLGNANQAAKDWILDPEKKQMRLLNQDFAELLLTGVLYEGWGAGPLSLATGLTWRDESFDQINFPSYGERGVLNAPALGIRAIPDGFASDGNRSLHPFSAIGVGGGARDVWEWFGEFNVPIWRWDSGQNIGSSFAYRSSNYSQAGKQNSWKIGLDAQVLDSLRWRATKSSDIREPNFAEIFLTGTGGGTVQDRFRNNEQNNALTVLATGNPTLGAEVGDTITTGFVWQPTFADWIEGLSVALDWYEINLKGAIALYGAQRIVDDCFATNDATVCALIQRLPPNADGSLGQISRILNQNINADRAQTRGTDLETSYRFETDFFDDYDETLSLRAILGYLAENSTTTRAGTTQDAAGGGTRPRYSGTLSAGYSLGDWNMSLNASYFDKTMANTTWVEGVDVDDNSIASQTTFNTALSYTGELESGGTWRASFNITNLFDRAPARFAGTGHDSLGRRYQLSLNVDF
jgi:outer membrane receptor protein involved in Fe transport